VTFETTYPRDLREAIRSNWTDLGFDHGAAYEPGARTDDADEGA
jgi:4-hydroxy-3-polyprenylbenzoate decarboxylase